MFGLRLISGCRVYTCVAILVTILNLVEKLCRYRFSGGRRTCHCMRTKTARSNPFAPTTVCAIVVVVGGRVNVFGPRSRVCQHTSGFCHCVLSMLSVSIVFDINDLVEVSSSS